MEYAAVFKAERNRRGWSQAAVARRVGVSRSQINNIEAGRTGGSARVLEALCRIYGLEPDAIGLLLNPVETPRLPEPNNPGVALLAADTDACRRHKITLEELHRLSRLLITIDHEVIPIATVDDALNFLNRIVRGSAANEP